MRGAVIAILLLSLASALGGLGLAQTLKLPRFVSLRSDLVNVRAGPGTQYPVAWVFVRDGLPVEVVAEFDTWRKVRDIDGAEGWVHQNLLSGTRRAVIVGEVRTLVRSPELAVPVAQAEPGVVARLLSCAGEWCRLEIAGHKGWLPRAQIWGVYPDETIN